MNIRKHKDKVWKSAGDEPAVRGLLRGGHIQVERLRIVLQGEMDDLTFVIVTPAGYEFLSHAEIVQETVLGHASPFGIVLPLEYRCSPGKLYAATRYAWA